MNSINEQQPEKNLSDLSGSDAVAKIREIAGNAKTCFFCTLLDRDGSPTRPMAVQEVDDQGDIWFLAASDSHLSEQVHEDSSVRLYFQGSAHSDFLVLNGTAKISADKQRIGELWEPLMKTWFTEGSDDPRIRVINVSPREGYYWDTKHGSFVASIKIVIGAAIGKTLDDSIEGRIGV